MSRWLQHVRAFARSSELAFVAVAVVIGAAAGLGVTVMTVTAQLAHVAIFGIAFDERLSAVYRVPVAAALLSPTLGGLALGVMEHLRRRLKIPSAIDPIEANALRGGAMSLRDSLVVSAQTVISNGCGASVGLEAGYAQLGAGIASVIGQRLRLRRQDLRMLVGAGAAAAIAGSFAAPLTGAFYAFELIVGAYSIANAVPIFAAALAATLTTRVLQGAPYVVVTPPVHALELTHYPVLILLGLVSAVVGIAAMRVAGATERGLDSINAPRWLRPAVGGAIVGAMALATPQVLGAGHGALGLDVPRDLSAQTLGFLIILKLTACLLSLAAGFRGGLFFASLFVGALMGKLFAIGVAWAAPNLGLDPTACILAGMGTLGVAIVGGPLTMSFLVLESTSNFAVTAGVLAACVTTSLAVRTTFGYSFSTWRLHLRGETIRSANDVGWLRDLTVGRLMARNMPTIANSATLDEFRAAHPLGSGQVVVLTDPNGRYAGLVSVPEIHALATNGAPGPALIGAFAKHVDFALNPEMDVKSAMTAFDGAQADLLAVVNPSTGVALGTLSEAYMARRYAEESNRAAQGVLGAA